MNDSLEIVTRETLARRCSLPKRELNEETGVLPSDTLPPGITQAQSDHFAFRNFLYDFCIDSTDRGSSKGYLSGFERFARTFSPTSDLVKACAAVGFAVHSRPLRRPSLGHRADVLYQEVVTVAVRSIANGADANDPELRCLVLLLGLHEVSQ